MTSTEAELIYKRWAEEVRNGGTDLTKQDLAALRRAIARLLAAKEQVDRCKRALDKIAGWEG